MPRILVVDESPSARETARSALERNGYEVMLVPDGAEGWNWLTAGHTVDLVLLDTKSPGMNAAQFCRALRADPERTSTPVILMSERAARIRDELIEATGALDAITKPFDEAALLIVLENVFRKVEQGGSGSSSRIPAVESDVGVVDSAAPSKKPATILSGDLGALPIGAILQLLQSENQTGVLVCVHRGAEIRAAFREGMIDLVEGSGTEDEFRLGRFFIEEGIISEAEIDTMVRLTGSSVPRRPLGATLLAMGKIVEDQLRTALVKQSSELLYDVFRWTQGRFELRRETPSELATSARLGLPVASVVIEGWSRVDEWRALEQTLPSFDAVLVRDEMVLGQLDATALPMRERSVLDAVDGSRTIRAIIRASHASSFDACRILAQFLEARALRRRPGSVHD